MNNKTTLTVPTESAKKLRVACAILGESIFDEFPKAVDAYVDRQGLGEQISRALTMQPKRRKTA